MSFPLALPAASNVGRASLPYKSANRNTAAKAQPQEQAAPLPHAEQLESHYGRLAFARACLKTLKLDTALKKTAHEEPSVYGEDTLTQHVTAALLEGRESPREVMNFCLNQFLPQKTAQQQSPGKLVMQQCFNTFRDVSKAPPPEQQAKAVIASLSEGGKTFEAQSFIRAIHRASQKEWEAHLSPEEQKKAPEIRLRARAMKRAIAQEPRLFVMAAEKGQAGLFRDLIECSGISIQKFKKKQLSAYLRINEIISGDPAMFEAALTADERSYPHAEKHMTKEDAFDALCNGRYIEAARYYKENPEAFFSSAYEGAAYTPAQRMYAPIGLSVYEKDLPYHRAQANRIAAFMQVTGLDKRKENAEGKGPLSMAAQDIDTALRERREGNTDYSWGALETASVLLRQTDISPVVNINNSEGKPKSIVPLLMQYTPEMWLSPRYKAMQDQALADACAHPDASPYDTTFRRDGTEVGVITFAAEKGCLEFLDRLTDAKKAFAIPYEEMTQLDQRKHARQKRREEYGMRADECVSLSKRFTRELARRQENPDNGLGI